jgi:hypothetical protein
MKVIRHGTVEFDGCRLLYRDWIVHAQGHRYATEFEAARAARVAVFIELARIADVYLEPVVTDFTGVVCSSSLDAERAARQAIEHARAPVKRRPWWRFWR